MKLLCRARLCSKVWNGDEEKIVRHTYQSCAGEEIGWDYMWFTQSAASNRIAVLCRHGTRAWAQKTISCQRPLFEPGGDVGPRFKTANFGNNVLVGIVMHWLVMGRQ